MIRVPLEDLRRSKALPFGARGYTKDPFVGGVAMEGTNGLWAMRFADPLYEKSFRFRKSVFFVDETLVCLGSGISNSDAAHPTETVLYQVAMPAGVTAASEPTHGTGAAHSQWLLDPVGNGYFLPSAEQLQIRSQQQQSIDNGGVHRTEGPFAVAWLNHGPAPSGAKYMYAIRPDTSARAIARYAAAADFQAIRHDDSAHIVRFPHEEIVGYALFAPAKGLDFDAIEGADAACLVMTRREGGRLILAVADPDLRLGTINMNGPFRAGGEGRLRLRLNGSWRVHTAANNIRAVDDKTLEITCRDGQSYEAVLTSK